MIEIIHGDMFDHISEAMVNTINCVGVMGKGVALEFKNRHPNMFHTYQQLCKGKAIKPGNVWIWRAPDYAVLNTATKYHWRDPSRYSWVREAAMTLNQQIIVNGFKTVAMPPLGCGNGGLQWRMVQSILETYLGHLGAVVKVCIKHT